MRSLVFRGIFRRSVVFLTLVGVFTFSVSGAAAAFRNIKVGDPALPFNLKDLDGREHSLNTYSEAESVLIFFWATWSQRSLTELADLSKFQDRYGEKGLQILAINVENQELDDGEISNIRSIIQENDIKFPVLIDRGLKTYNEWGVIATPTTALVSSDGVITFDLSSYPTSGYVDMDTAIRKTLGIYTENVQEAEAAVSYEPTREALLHFGLGKRHAEKGFMTKALPELEKAAEADSGWAQPQMYLGYVHSRTGDKTQAMASLDRAFILDPDITEIRWLRAYLMTTDEKVDDALALLLGKEFADKTNKADPSGPGTLAEEKTDQTVDLSGVIALKEEGRTADAAAALEQLLAEKLDAAGFTMKKKKMSAMEKMKLMMQEKQGN